MQYTGNKIKLENLNKLIIPERKLKMCRIIKIWNSVTNVSTLMTLKTVLTNIYLCTSHRLFKLVRKDALAHNNLKFI